nr:hypothetical protein [Gammaproteobacteria bacterium]
MIQVIKRWDKHFVFEKEFCLEVDTNALHHIAILLEKHIECKAYGKFCWTLKKIRFMLPSMMDCIDYYRRVLVIVKVLDVNKPTLVSLSKNFHGPKTSGATEISFWSSLMNDECHQDINNNFFPSMHDYMKYDQLPQHSHGFTDLHYMKPGIIVKNQQLSIKKRGVLSFSWILLNVFDPAVIGKSIWICSEKLILAYALVKKITLCYDISVLQHNVRRHGIHDAHYMKHPAIYNALRKNEKLYIYVITSLHTLDEPKEHRFAGKRNFFSLTLSEKRMNINPQFGAPDKSLDKDSVWHYYINYFMQQCKNIELNGKVMICLSNVAQNLLVFLWAGSFTLMLAAKNKSIRHLLNNLKFKKSDEKVIWNIIQPHPSGGYVPYGGVVYQDRNKIIRPWKKCIAQCTNMHQRTVRDLCGPKKTTHPINKVDSTVSRQRSDSYKLILRCWQSTNVVLYEQLVKPKCDKRCSRCGKGAKNNYDGMKHVDCSSCSKSVHLSCGEDIPYFPAYHTMNMTNFMQSRHFLKPKNVNAV